MSIIWNPWHGCRKLSEGCARCYVYRRDSMFGKDSSVLQKNSSFYYPIEKFPNGDFKAAGFQVVYTCFTSDFFLEEAADLRREAWRIIKARSDLHFYIVTKRISLFEKSIPDDWGGGYKNVEIVCTCENQIRADERLKIFLDLPISRRGVICEPLLESLDIEKYLGSGAISEVIAGGESGGGARVCDFKWIENLRQQCERTETDFFFKQTGALFKKGESIYKIPRKLQHAQARKAGVNLRFKKNALDLSRLAPVGQMTLF